MGEAAEDLGTLFEHVATRPGCSRHLEFAGDLAVADDLEEVPVVGVRQHLQISGRAIRAFVVRSRALTADGLQAGDYVLVDATATVSPEALALIDVGGRRLVRLPRLLPPELAQGSMVGAIIGVLRKRGFGDRETRQPPDHRPPDRRLVQARLLRGRLGMLESTCAATCNPKLRRALQNEAARVRKQLQVGASKNKLR
jgi:hypothetical protein